MKKLICLLTTFLSLFFMMKPVEATGLKWEISKSKTATQLDSNYQSQVALSLPSKSENLVSDVVFVLDKSTSAQIENQALEMLEQLKAQIEKTDAKVKVGIVIFNKTAHVSSWFNLTSQMSQIKEAIQQEITSGTNSHAGLLAGKELLDNDKEVEAQRKYMVFVSDGITYMYNQETTVTAWSFENDGGVLNWAGPDNFKSKYSDSIPEWNTYFKNVKNQLESQGNKYDYIYGQTPTVSTPVLESNQYLNSVDKALYYTNDTYQNMKEEGYHCYVMKANGQSHYPWATSFMEYLSNNEEVSFDAIQNDIYYLLDKGSYVEDYIGQGKDQFGNEYNFDFVNEVNQFYMMVGQKKYTPEMIEDDTCYHYGFNKQNDGYDYELYYYSGVEEHFIWKMNVPVTQFDPVQLIYTVILTNPQEQAGEYGYYDEDGHLNKDNLKTNIRATLHPVDSNGNALEIEDFLNPTVSYSVQNTKIQENPKQETKIQTAKKSVKTGDEQMIYPYIVLSLLTISIVSVLKRRLEE